MILLWCDVSGPATSGGQWGLSLTAHTLGNKTSAEVKVPHQLLSVEKIYSVYWKSVEVRWGI